MPRCRCRAEQEAGYHEIEPDTQQRVPRRHKCLWLLQVETDIPASKLPDAGA